MKQMGQWYRAEAVRHKFVMKELEVQVWGRLVVFTGCGWDGAYVA